MPLLRSVSTLGATLAALLLLGDVLAVPIVDGTADAFYGPALSIQNTQTQFGDNSSGDLIDTQTGGSEIDQVFAVVAGGRLYVTVAGNLENNFSRLEVFFDVDSASGGVNEIIGNSLPAGVDPFCCGGFGTFDGALQRMDSLTFDDSFFADYYLTFSHGAQTVGLNSGGTLSFWAMSAHFADLTEGTAGRVVDAGMQLGPQGLPNVLRVGGMAGTFAAPASIPADASPTTSLVGPALPGLEQGELIDKNYALGEGGCDVSGAGCIARELEFALPVDMAGDPNNTKSHRNIDNTIDLQMALDNSNVEGVSAGGEPIGGDDDPQNVVTGIEFSIPLSQLPNFLNLIPTDSIRMVIFVTGTGHDFVSNQFAGEGVLQGNFGTLLPNLEAKAVGDQFVAVTALPGDYNHDNLVSAADYVLWRDGLPAPHTPLDSADYETWKQNFGSGAGEAAYFNIVPEPTSAVLIVSGVAVLTWMRGKCRWLLTASLGITPWFLSAGPLARQTTGAEISIDPRATYLRTNQDPGALAATPFAISTLGIVPGNLLRLERIGDFDCGAPCVDDRAGMIGVFSASTTLLAADQPHRVPDAIDAGQDFITSRTNFGSLPTDIPEDFLITDTIVVTPVGATHLFITANDSLYYDNTDPDGDFAVRVTILPALPGDYNHDNLVSAADYVLWRDGLPAPHTPVNPADYETWKQNFGNGAGAAGKLNAVPEPSGFALWLVVTILFVCSLARDQLQNGLLHVTGRITSSFRKHLAPAHRGLGFTRRLRSMWLSPVPYAWLFAVTLLDGSPLAAWGTSYSWDGSSNTQFSNANNWTPVGVPGAADSATFRLGNVPAYPVLLFQGLFDPINATVDRMIVGTNTVNLAGGVLTVDSTDATEVGRGLIIGQTASDVAVVNSALQGLSTTYATLGSAAGSSGTLNVNGGTFSVTGLTPTHDLIVGLFGSGAVNVSGGHDVIVNDATMLGLYSGSSGSISLSGTGSTWNNSGGILYVGGAGSGSVDISGGGHLSADSVYIGAEADGNGDLLVTGSNSMLFIETGSTFVGLMGSGTLEVTAGGRVSSRDSYVGYVLGQTSNPGEGTVLVDGADSNWTMSGALVIGGNYATGTLTISGGGRASSKLAVIGYDSGSVVSDRSMGTVNVTGSTSLWDNTEEILIGTGRSSGSLNITSGGRVNSANGYVGNSFGATANVTVDGLNSRWNNTGYVNVDNGGPGTLTVTNHGVVQATNLYIGSRGEVHGNGTLVGNVHNAGLVAPGTSIGTLDIIGSYTQFGDGTFGDGELLVELASAASYDRLEITGNAMLDGALTVLLLDGFLPAAGDSFAILSADGDLSGTFANVANGQRLATVDGEGSFLVSYNVVTDTVVLSAFAIAGDYNLDGTVNAADYVLWRDGLPVPHTPLDPQDYETWKQNFGNGAGEAAGLNAVPEPSTLLLLGLAALLRSQWLRILRPFQPCD